MVEYFDESYFKDYSKSEVKVKTKKFVPAESYEALEAKLARLVAAAELKRNAIVINAEDFIQHLHGRWVAVPEEDFDKLRAAVAAAKGTP